MGILGKASCDSVITNSLQDLSHLRNDVCSFCIVVNYSYCSLRSFTQSSDNAGRDMQFNVGEVFTGMFNIKKLSRYFSMWRVAQVSAYLNTCLSK